MNLCVNNHEEVCFEGRHCPACAVADEKDRVISNLEDKISGLENQIGELEGTIEDLTAKEVAP